MNRSPALSASLLLQQAAPRPPRLGALLLFVLTTAVTACGVRPAGPTNQGPTSLPTIVAHSAIVCDPPAQPAPAGGCVVQDAATGVSLRVANAYADATSTIVQMQTTNTAGYPLMIREPHLALASGRTFQGGAVWAVRLPA